MCYLQKQKLRRAKVEEDITCFEEIKELVMKDS